MRRRAPGHAAIGWRHLQCFHPPAGFEIAHLRGAPLLAKKDLARVARRLRKVAMQAEAHGLGPRRGSKGGDAREASPAIAAAAPPKRKKRHPEEFAARGIEGRHAAAEQALAHAHPGDARFALTPGGPDVTVERVMAVRGKYDGMHVDELKEVLKANEQLLGGSKDELATRCTEGELRGALPACPTCGVGRLHVAYRGDQATYTCPGYFDNEAKTFIRWCVHLVLLSACCCCIAFLTLGGAQPVHEPRGGALAVGDAGRRRAERAWQREKRRCSSSSLRRGPAGIFADESGDTAARTHDVRESSSRNTESASIPTSSSLPATALRLAASPAPAAPPPRTRA